MGLVYVLGFMGVKGWVRGQGFGVTPSVHHPQLFPRSYRYFAILRCVMGCSM